MLTRRLVLQNKNTLSSLSAATQICHNDHVLINETEHNATITINRPEILNAVNFEMLRKIDMNWRKFEKTKSFVIFKGAGERNFSVGGDVPSILLNGASSFFRLAYALFNFESQTPNIYLIDGATMGGGYAMTLRGSRSYRVATERTVFAMPENAIGFIPECGSSYFLNKLNGKLGIFLGLTGSHLKAEDVVRVGLATHFCKSKQLDDLESQLTKATDSNEIPKILKSFCVEIPPSERIQYLMNKINTCFDAETIEEILENLQRDGSEWSLRTLKILKKLCPLSLKLALRLMQIGASKPLDECLKMEFRIVFRRLGDTDLQEGIRAVLVDKDNRPKWNPPTLDAVTEEAIDKYFERLPESEELKL